MKIVLSEEQLRSGVERLAIDIARHYVAALEAGELTPGSLT